MVLGKKSQKRKRRHAERADGASEDSDGSQEDAEETRQKKKTNKDSKKKSHKKHKRHKREKEEEGVDEKPHEPISEDDYYLKHSEFATWLLEDQGIRFDELMSDESHGAFTTFVERWNSGRLSSKYYRGMTALPMRRTNHKWNFTDEVPSRQNTGASGLRTSWKDEQNRREIDWARNRKERRKWRKQQEEVLDELLPKPTGGREARIEKKAARREARRASSPGQLMLSPGGDIMGGDDTLAEAKKREEAWRERKMQRMEQRREEALKKLSDYQVTEDEKLDPFRALISESGGSIKIPKRSGA